MDRISTKTSGDLYFLACLVSQFDSFPPSPPFSSPSLQVLALKIGHLVFESTRGIFSGNKFNLVVKRFKFRIDRSGFGLIGINVSFLFESWNLVMRGEWAGGVDLIRNWPSLI